MVPSREQVPTAGGGPTALRDLTNPPLLAGEIRTVVVRLARQLRRQDLRGLTVTLYSALVTVAAASELPIGTLAEAERLPSSAATRIADRLEEEGLVERRRNPNDRRGVNLAITPAGRAVVDELRATHNAWLAARLERLSDSERATLAEAAGLLGALLADDEPEMAGTDAQRRITP